MSQNLLPLDFTVVLLPRFGAECFVVEACSSNVSAVVSIGRLPSVEVLCGRRPPVRRERSEAHAAGIEGSTINDGCD